MLTTCSVVRDCRFARLAADLAQHVTELRNISSIDARTVSVAVFQQAAEACIINMQNHRGPLSQPAEAGCKARSHSRYNVTCKKLCWCTCVTSSLQLPAVVPWSVLEWTAKTATCCSRIEHAESCHARRLFSTPLLQQTMVACTAIVIVWSAARPKERRRYDAKCKELAKQLEQKVAQYNKLLPYGQLPGRAQPIMSDLRSQRFCWVEEYAG